MSLCYLLSLNPTSYGILKNLRESGFEVHLFHVTGGLERFLDRTVILHRLSFEDDPHAVVDALRRRPAGELATVFTSSDREISFLERFWDDLKDCVSLPFLRAEALHLINNKYEFFKITKELGIASPRSYCVRCTDTDLADLDVGWPRLMKPVHSEEWKSPEASSLLHGKKAIVVNTPADLVLRMRDLRKLSATLLVQEIIDAADDGSYSFCSYSDKNGKVLWGFVTQKLLQYPDRFGTAILCQTADRPDVAALGRSIVESLCISGVSETEILINRYTNKLAVIEVNTRHWLQHRLSTCLGVNISLLDHYYRSGDNAQADKLLSTPRPNTPALWIDDIAYLTHAAKHWSCTRALHLEHFRHKILEFSLLESRTIMPLLILLLKRISSP